MNENTDGTQDTKATNLREVRAAALRAPMLLRHLDGGMVMNEIAVRKKPITVLARGPLVESEVVITAHGRVRAEAGDYVIRDPNSNDTWPIKPDLFAATYDPIEE